MNNFCVYAHTKPDGTIFYIGKGLKRRSKEVRGRNKYWNNVVNKYGFNIVILADTLTNNEAMYEEIQLIKHFKKFGSLTNMTDGGEGMTGYKMSEQAKKAIQDTKWGNKNPSFKGDILGINILTGIKKVYRGNKQLEADGFDNSRVYNCINGSRKTHKGHTFERLGEYHR
jgi:hypothetical protein